jgi:hypothetical protein
MSAIKDGRMNQEFIAKLYIIMENKFDHVEMDA